MSQRDDLIDAACQAAADEIVSLRAELAEARQELARIRPMIGIHDPTGADHMEDAGGTGVTRHRRSRGLVRRRR